MTDTNRWYIDVEAPGAAQMRPAIVWFLERIASSPDRRGLLAVPGKGNLTGTGIETLLGSAKTKKLSRDNKIQIQSVVIELMTQKINPHYWSGPVLAVYPDKKLLDAVDSLQTPSDILVVPWLRREGTEWAQTWGARELSSSADPSPKQFSNPMVQAALQSLTNRVNLSTGLAHPSDRSAAIKLFRILRGAGERYDPTEVRAWLVSELGWQPRHANEAAGVARDILAGKKLRSSASGEWAPDILKQWRERGSSDPDRS